MLYNKFLQLILNDKDVNYISYNIKKNSIEIEKTYIECDSNEATIKFATKYIQLDKFISDSKIYYLNNNIEILNVANKIIVNFINVLNKEKTMIYSINIVDEDDDTLEYFEAFNWCSNYVDFLNGRI